MTEGYLQKDHGRRTKRYCQIMELRDDAELIRRYVEAHSEEKARSIVLKGIREVGIEEMEVYLLGNRIVMIATLACPFGDKGRCDIHLLHLLSVDKLGLSDLLHLRAALLVHTYIRTFTILRYGKLLTVEYKSCVVRVRHCG